MSSSTFWAGMPVCVLGGSGFLGGHLVRQLLDRGAIVRTLSLPSPAPPVPGVEERIGDIRDPEAVRSAADGARIVFLAAGPVGVGPKASRTMVAHEDGLRVVLDAVPQSARLILTSSVVAVGATPTGEVLTEDSPFTLNAIKIGYVHAKRTAEEEAVRAASQGHDIVIVNPGYLFGPDDPGPSVMGTFCLRFWRGRVPFAPPGGINCVDVRDVAAGHLLAAEKGVSGRRYILGGENLTMRELMGRLAEVAHLRPRWLPRVPRPVFAGLALWNEGLSRLTGKEAFPSLEHVRLNRLFWYHSSHRAETELGYRSRPFDQTLADAFAWHAAHTRATPRGFNRWWFRAA